MFEEFKNKIRKSLKIAIGLIPITGLNLMRHLIDYLMKFEYVVKESKNYPALSRKWNKLIISSKPDVMSFRNYIAEPTFWLQFIALGVGLLYWAYIFEKWPFELKAAGIGLDYKSRKRILDRFSMADPIELKFDNTSDYCRTIADEQVFWCHIICRAKAITNVRAFIYLNSRHELDIPRYDRKENPLLSMNRSYRVELFRYNKKRKEILLEKRKLAVKTEIGKKHIFTIKIKSNDQDIQTRQFTLTILSNRLIDIKAIDLTSYLKK